MQSINSIEATSVPVSQVREFISTYSIVNRLRTHQGEVLFVERKVADELKSMSGENMPPVVQEDDIWEELSNPFLDTETPTVEQNIPIMVRRFGISEKECREIYSQIAKPMWSYNFDTMLWEWGILNFYDVIGAMARILNDDEFAKFYKYSMQIADKYRNKIAK
jgi:hypothetical protein